MKFVTVKESDSIELIPLADLHLGSELTNLRRIHQIIEHIRENPKARVVILGDLLESAIIGSKGNPYKAKSIDEEVRLAVSVLKPIKDKIIGIISGNHSNRISKTIGLDILALLSRKLGIDRYYSPDFLVLRISLPKTAWYVVLHHGVGGGRLKGGKINNLHRFGNIFPNADIILIGHTHDFIMTVDKKYIIDKKHNSIKTHKTFYINVPSLAMEYGGYASSYAYPPSVTGTIKIYLPNIPNSKKKTFELKVEHIFV